MFKEMLCMVYEHNSTLHQLYKLKCVYRSLVAPEEAAII